MGLIERITTTGDLRNWYGEMPVGQQYTVGLAGERFFRAIRDEGRFMATRCSKCSVLYLPPRMYCERCFDELTEWEEAPNRGLVQAVTILHMDLDGERLLQPQPYAVVQIEGVHGGLIHRLQMTPGVAAGIGSAVEAVFRPKRQRKGSILDIECFRPI